MNPFDKPRMEGERSPFPSRTQKPPMRAESASSRGPAYRQPTLAGIRILVVDDEVDVLDFITFVLERYGAKVTPVGSAAEALAQIDQQLPDVLLSDIGMPGENGYDLIRKIRARPPERGGKIPAVAVTALSRSEDRTHALVAGYQIHMPKPVEPIQLATIIENLLGRWSA